MDKKSQRGGEVEIPSEPPVGYNGEINPDLRNYNMFREFWKKQPWVQKSINSYEQLPEWTKVGIDAIISLFPENALAAVPVTKLPKGVLRILPDGTKIMDPKASGASAGAKRIFKNQDKYFEKTPEATINKDIIVRNMQKDGIDLSVKDQNKIFGEVANGKNFLYDKYLK